MKTLANLEKLLEQLIEGTFDRLFKSRLHPADLGTALAAAMERGQISDGRGAYIAPNHYLVALNPRDYQVLRAESDMADEVAAIERYLSGLMAEIGGRSAEKLQISLQPRANIKPGKIEVVADHLAHYEASLPEQTSSDDTRQMNTTVIIPANRWRLQLPDRQVRLGMPVVRIGREANNDIVISDQTVSRYHAQLRWQNRAYYVKNLSRTQPVMLNRRPIEGSRLLKPDDTLQLGRVTLIVEIIL